MSDATFTILRAHAGDAAAIAEIYNEAVRTTTATFDTEPQSAEDRLRWLEAHDDRHPVFVAEADGQIAGWSALTKWSDRPAYHRTAETSCYVAEAFRGRGIGRALKKTLIEAARGLGFHTLLARVAQGSEASIHINASFGFEAIGTMKEVGFKFGRWLDVHLLQLVLEDPRAEPAEPTTSRPACRRALPSDAPSLASMNRQLIEDEGSRNPMSLAELEERMRGWLSGDWQAVILEEESQPIGYLLYQLRTEEYHPSKPVVYVRQFFIRREHRGQGIGRRAFQSAVDSCFPPSAEIVLDVLETNPRACRFWSSIGFEPYCTTMRRLKP